MRIIILRGTKDAVSKAEMELKRLSENIPKRRIPLARYLFLLYFSVPSFGETETIIDVQKPFVIPQQTPFNTFSKKLGQKRLI
ncbi:KH domain-containing protein [Meloidogyne graminicola]|uniref:KH domain-containing protein n=1 Tax=Meloidogyne graminicola TaxID=189291 RepID=A0A8S9ZPE8_9BILA|nr:KH domain-containing protein [Meloidogyne graminicola]